MRVLTVLEEYLEDEAHLLKFVSFYLFFVNIIPIIFFLHNGHFSQLVNICQDIFLQSTIKNIIALYHYITVYRCTVFSIAFACKLLKICHNFNYYSLFFQVKMKSFWLILL